MDTQTTAPVIANKGTFPAKVARVIDPYQLVINRGQADGIRKGQRMLVYYIDEEEIQDPDTGESLGFLELVRGTGRTILVEEKFSILESDTLYRKFSEPQAKTKEELLSQINPTVINPLIALQEGMLKPFDHPKVGDLVKAI
ncbi:MAG: hypothetical protein ACK5CA_06330 [Cyanobacteriota bacterium]|jgi:hypothetical protein